MAMNRVDVVDLVVDLVDVDLDIDLVDVDLDADLVDVGLVDVVPAAFSVFGLQLYLCFWPLAKKYERSQGSQNCVTPENDIFEILKEMGLKSDSKSHQPSGRQVV